MLKTRRCLIRPETAETENRLRDGCGSQLNPLFGNRDAEPVGAFVREATRAFDGAMTVRVRFDDRHDSRRGTDELLDLIKVCGDIVEMYLGPRRPSGKFDLALARLVLE